MKPADEILLPVVLRQSHDPEPGRCIYCDQRCQSTAIFHAYCLELHDSSAASVPAVETGGDKS